MAMRVINAATIASRGMAMGRAVIYARRCLCADKRGIAPEQAGAEMERYAAAVDKAVAQVSALADRSGVFAAYADLLRDCALAELVCDNIKKGRQNCELAVENAVRAFSEMLETMDDDYMRERAADVRDIGDRLLTILQGGAEEKAVCPPEGRIVVIADDLTPSDTVKMDKDRIAGFITQRGGVTSHVAIIARSMGIPAFVGAQGVLEHAADGETVLMDAVGGKIILDPGETELADFMIRSRRWEEERKRLLQYGRMPADTADGRHVKVFANAGGLEDVRRAAEYGADGIGLFRTEFLYMDRDGFPTEEEQFQVYREAAAGFGREITIRTLDIGGDKALRYFNFEPEDNPFLGWRAIRISLSMEDMFKTQLRAILRAGFFGKLRIMCPMIISCEELEQANRILEACKAELAAEGKPYDKDISVGMMMETPASVLLAEEFARRVDFFSIGTNDLTQYVLAVDRGNRRISGLYNARHPAVLRSVDRIVRAGRAAGIEVGMCGEFAADTGAARLLIGMGMDELSVAPASVPDVKKAIRELRMEEAEGTADKLRNCFSLRDVEELLSGGGGD